MYDFHLVTIFQHGRGMFRAFEDCEVHLNDHSFWHNLQGLQQLRHCRTIRNVLLDTVDPYFHVPRPMAHGPTIMSYLE